MIAFSILGLLVVLCAIFRPDLIRHGGGQGR